MVGPSVIVLKVKNGTQGFYHLGNWFQLRLKQSLNRKWWWRKKGKKSTKKNGKEIERGKEKKKKNKIRLLLAASKKGKVKTLKIHPRSGEKFNEIEECRIFFLFKTRIWPGFLMSHQLSEFGNWFFNIWWLVYDRTGFWPGSWYFWLNQVVWSGFDKIDQDESVCLEEPK